MPHVFVACYADLAATEAELEQPSIRDCDLRDALVQMASPQVAHVMMEMTDANVQKVLAAAKEEFMQNFEGEDEDDIPDTHWVFEAHEVPKYGRENWTWTLSDGTTEPQMLVVIQKMELL